MNDNPSPGSDEALALGCRCPVLDNSYGKGYLCSGNVFVMSNDCPLHGSKHSVETKEIGDE